MFFSTEWQLQLLPGIFEVQVRRHPSQSPRTDLQYENISRLTTGTYWRFNFVESNNLLIETDENSCIRVNHLQKNKTHTHIIQIYFHWPHL